LQRRQRQDYNGDCFTKSGSKMRSRSFHGGVTARWSLQG
jgi:hypothetical protein